MASIRDACASSISRSRPAPRHDSNSSKRASRATARRCRSPTRIRSTRPVSIRDSCDRDMPHRAPRAACVNRRRRRRTRTARPKRIASMGPTLPAAGYARLHCRFAPSCGGRSSLRSGGARRMCFDLDSRPPILPIAGGALDSNELVLESRDGNQFRAFLARATESGGAGIVIMPDVRGLHPFYEELALRFAENGVAALAIDYFGRTAGISGRGDDFEHMPHVEQTTWPGIAADIQAGAENLRMEDEERV